ncbi:MAG: hemerythrin family protein [bacterium]|nr:hemerythrin family protein [bacterium]
MESKWTEDLATNIPVIDTQHKNLITRTNEFLRVISQGRGQKEIETAVKILDEIAQSHFETEEKFMLQHTFPDYKLHKIQHQNYIKVIESLNSEYEFIGSSSDFVKKTKLLLLSYLQNHIKEFDKPLADFLRKTKDQSILQ